MLSKKKSLRCDHWHLTRLTAAAIGQGRSAVGGEYSLSGCSHVLPLPDDSDARALAVLDSDDSDSASIDGCAEAAVDGQPPASLFYDSHEGAPLLHPIQTG
jgi:hypothetical protein